VAGKAQIQSVSQRVSYSGPLPTASEFAAYDKALPGTAERLLSMVEKESEHRHESDRKALSIFNLGQTFSFILSILSLGAVGLCIVFSQPGASIAPALIAIPSILSIIFNRKK
jgi:uncharacterized membrane protein